ncbi:hypothetical protein Btru_077045 [Bulinus truncatus]|nr:hypothetical protein Btru_077045 [Bulinus truncatus]
MVASPEQEVRFVPIIFQLSNAGIDLNKRDISGATAVKIAVTRRLPQILAALLKCGAEFTEDDQYCLEQVKGVAKSEMMELVRRLTPSYWVAVHDPTPFKVHRLVKSWSRVNLTRNNLTLIEYAKRNVKDESIVKLLLQHEASIELAHAVMAGDSDRVKVLLCHGDIDLDSRDASVKNNCFEPFAPLSLVGAAIKYDHVDVLKVLRQAKANRKSYGQQKPPCGENTEAGGDNSVLIKRGHSYEGAGVSVFHYSSAHGGSCRAPELMTTPSAVCDIFATMCSATMCIATMCSATMCSATVCIATVYIATMCSASMCIATMCTATMCSATVCSATVCIATVCIATMCIATMCIATMCSATMCSATVCIATVCIATMCIATVCIATVCIATVCIATMCIATVCIATMCIAVSGYT